MTISSGFGVLSPPWVEIRYRPRLGLRWRKLRMGPVRVGQLGRFLECVAPFLGSEKNAEGHDAAVIEAIAMLSGEDRRRVKRLPGHVKAAAVYVMVELNPEVFKRDADDAMEPAEQVWPLAVAELLSAGHSLTDIKGYTLSQLKTHLDAARRLNELRFHQAFASARLNRDRADALT